MKSMYKIKVKDRLRGKPHLRPVYSNTYCIPERLRAMDSNLFVVFNTKTQKYEIHSLANKGDSFSLQVPFRELDARCENFVMKYDLRRHGWQIYRDIEAENEERERAMEREQANRAQILASELHKPVRKLAYWGE